MHALESTSDLRIREATPADVPALAELRYALRTESDSATEPPARFLVRCAAWMAARLAGDSSWRCWLVASDGERIVGNLWLQLIEKMPNPVDEPELHAYVSNVYVLPEARGAGLGGGLLQAALACCRARGVDAVILWPTPRSRPLYERHGFAVPKDLFELRLAPSAH
jgi:GNAT superfamily N-acetyltransferase